MDSVSKILVTICIQDRTPAQVVCIGRQSHYVDQLQRLFRHVHLNDVPRLSASFKLNSHRHRLTKI